MDVLEGQEMFARGSFVRFLFVVRQGHVIMPAVVGACLSSQ